VTGKRRGYYDAVAEEGRVFRVTMPVNPYSLMELVDKVYVCSTQFGFEALMAGKEVHVYGMPFYAGWGLTIDRQRNPRRTNRRSLEEVFHIFYNLYTRWTDPETGEAWTVDRAIDHLVALRAEYAAFRQSATQETRP
jgi:capsular polysaccharide export protein